MSTPNWNRHLYFCHVAIFINSRSNPTVRRKSSRGSCRGSEFDPPASSHVPAADVISIQIRRRLEAGSLSINQFEQLVAGAAQLGAHAGAAQLGAHAGAAQLGAQLETQQRGLQRFSLGMQIFGQLSFGKRMRWQRGLQQLWQPLLQPQATGAGAAQAGAQVGAATGAAQLGAQAGAAAGAQAGAAQEGAQAGAAQLGAAEQQLL